MSATQLTITEEFLNKLSSSASTLDPPPNVEHSLAEVKTSFEQLSSSYTLVREQWIEQQKLAPKSNQQSTNSEVEQLWKDYALLKKNMFPIGDKLITISKSKSLESSKKSEQFIWVSSLLYVLGTLLALYGRIKGARAT